MQPIDLAKAAAAAAADRKASRIVLMDLRGVSEICDFQLICSGDNDRHTRAIADAIEEHCRKIGGGKPLAMEGKQSGHWIVLDYGSTMVHIFFSELRDYYALEQLWPSAKNVPLAAPLSEVP